MDLDFARKRVCHQELIGDSKVVIGFLAGEWIARIAPQGGIAVVISHDSGVTHAFPWRNGILSAIPIVAIRPVEIKQSGPGGQGRF